MRIDSFRLSPETLGLFDLVWVDAWHRFPNVAWDTHLGYHVCRPGGLMISDDVKFNEDYSRSGVDAGLIYHYLVNIGLPVKLFSKRFRPEYLANGRKNCKFVTVLRKPEHVSSLPPSLATVG